MVRFCWKKKKKKKKPMVMFQEMIKRRFKPIQKATFELILYFFCLFLVLGRKKERRKKEDPSHKIRAGVLGQHWNLGQASRQKKKRKERKERKKNWREVEMLKSKSIFLIEICP